eukprot:Rhum_TRINITY_DN6046_c0_g1::Rhum_TRINITY_DN6046_c0_g1_i1::g.18914::m.18914
MSRTVSLFARRYVEDTQQQQQQPRRPLLILQRQDPQRIPVVQLLHHLAVHRRESGVHPVRLLHRLPRLPHLLRPCKRLLARREDALHHRHLRRVDQRLAVEAQRVSLLGLCLQRRQVLVRHRHAVEARHALRTRRQHHRLQRVQQGLPVGGDRPRQTQVDGEVLSAGHEGGGGGRDARCVEHAARRLDVGPQAFAGDVCGQVLGGVDDLREEEPHVLVAEGGEVGGAPRRVEAVQAHDGVDAVRRAHLEGGEDGRARSVLVGRAHGVLQVEDDEVGAGDTGDGLRKRLGVVAADEHAGAHLAEQTLLATGEHCAFFLLPLSGHVCVRV